MARREEVGKNILYTCNCGWIDTNHANPGTARQRTDIGAVNLWNQMIHEQLQKKSEQKKPAGFKVRYSQDMRRAGITVGDTRDYFVKYGLTTAEKEAVALTIFQEVTHLFETTQGSFPWAIVSGHSSYSEDDLVSNLISFYVALRSFGLDYYIDLCKPVPASTALELWDRNKGLTKNYNFSPIFYSSVTGCTCPSFPKELQLIKPAVKGTSSFRNWRLVPVSQMSALFQDLSQADEIFITP